MLSIICFIIVILGCINWLSIGFFQYDIVAGIFGYQGSIFSRIVYIIVGISALFLVYFVIKHKGKISVKKILKQDKIKREVKKDMQEEEKQRELELEKEEHYQDQKDFERDVFLEQQNKDERLSDNQ